MNIHKLKSLLDEKKGVRKSKKEDLKNAKSRAVEARKNLRFSEMAEKIIREVALQTQRQLEYHISELVTLSLAGIFPDPYELHVEFVERRKKPECDVLFKKGDQFFHPMRSVGGGAVDVASISLRFAMWSIRQPRTRPFLFFDEPFRFLSRDLHYKASMMLKEISERLKIQILMVSHSPDLIEGADRVFETSIKNGVSSVGTLEESMTNEIKI